MRTRDIVGTALIAACLVFVGLPASAEAGQWRWAGGAQIDPASHGIVDLGYRSSNLSIQLLTDTVDLRYKQPVKGGQWQFGLRGALFGAELLFSPWKNGKPAPTEALRASYLGVDLSRAWWFRGGIYARVSSEFCYYDFGKWQDATRVVPKARGRLRSALKLGVWRSDLRAQILSGFIQDGDFRGWWVEGRFALPRTTGFGWMNQTHLGWSQGLSRVSKFRLGGLNPYVLPFAGLGWAQFWVERYALQRFGLGYRSDDSVYDFRLGTDVGLWDEESLKASPVLMASYARGNRKVAASGGVLTWEKSELGFHGWSLFLWYEHTWH